MKSVRYLDHLPDPSSIGAEVLCIVDKNLLSKNKIVKKWISKCSFVYVVESGEKLKDLKFFHLHIEKIIEIISESSKKNLTIVALGGGTVGDFSGFVASVLKRGVGFVQIPSTWLAAIDSAHGGKNGLNAGTFKNQIGTVYLPKQVYVVKEVLKSQPMVQVQDAMGELLKMAIIDGGSQAKKCFQQNKFDFDFMWKSLSWAIPAKYKVVGQDLYETKGIRYVLNLGHTMGHAYELNQKLSHGQSVFWGLEFAVHLSLKNKFLTQQAADKIMKSPAVVELKKQFKPLKKTSTKQMLKALSQDKKRESKKAVNFVFIKNIGDVIVKPISIHEICFEAIKLQWAKRD